MPSTSADPADRPHLPEREFSEAEMGAMPEADYMNGAQLGVFRRKLLRLRAELLGSPSLNNELLREEPLVVPDPVDRATMEEEHTLGLNARARSDAFFRKIEDALARIDSGDYGYCEETGEPIGIARLLARPTAKLSLEAQERREFRQKMGEA